MPEEFDPTWEYWTADPEIEEVMRRNGQGISVMERLVDARWEEGGKPGNMGLRFGKGKKWDNFHERLAREKPRAMREPRKEYQLVCEKCGGMFRTYRRARIYCSRRCAAIGYASSVDRRVVKLHPKICKGCGIQFVAWRYDAQYHSQECMRASLTGKYRVPSEFKGLYLAGAPMKELERMLGVTLQTLQKWRAKLGLPPRPVGNHKRAMASEPIPSKQPVGERALLFHPEQLE